MNDENHACVRPMTVASISGPRGDPDTILRMIGETAREKPDLILLPENWRDCPGETEDTGVMPALRRIAAENKVYIAHPTTADERGVKYNSVFLIDRNGSVAGRYDKAYPYWGEFGPDAPYKISPGRSRSVFDCDFGKVGIAVCFDANFPEVWQKMAEEGAELVLWPSAYGAGAQLAAHALNHHYYIVTATNEGYTMAFDLDGERIMDRFCPELHVETITLDLDRCIFHENFNTEKLEALLSEKPPKVALEKHLRAEQWLIVRSSSGAPARETCAKAGMEELRAYKKRSYEAINRMRRDCGR